MFVFKERGKPEYPEKNLSEQSREPTTNSTHIWRLVRESNLGHIAGRWALSPLRQPCPHYRILWMHRRVCEISLTACMVLMRKDISEKVVFFLKCQHAFVSCYSAPSWIVANCCLWQHWMKTRLYPINRPFWLPSRDFLEKLNPLLNRQLYRGEGYFCKLI